MKSTIDSILAAVRVVEKLDAKGRLHIYRYLMNEQQNAPPTKERKKKREQKPDEDGAL